MIFFVSSPFFLSTSCKRWRRSKKYRVGQKKVETKTRLRKWFKGGDDDGFLCPLEFWREMRERERERANLRGGGVADDSGMRPWRNGSEWVLALINVDCLSNEIVLWCYEHSEQRRKECKQLKLLWVSDQVLVLTRGCLFFVETNIIEQKRIIVLFVREHNAMKYQKQT